MREALDQPSHHWIVKERVPSLPDIPTLEEVGVHGCISDNRAM